MQPAEYASLYQGGLLGAFDAVVTYLSLEHSGLGWYCNPLNPCENILEVARSWCVTRPGGGLVIGISECDSDALLYNAAQVYVPTRLPVLATNWDLRFTTERQGLGGMRDCRCCTYPHESVDCCAERVFVFIKPSHVEHEIWTNQQGCKMTHHSLLSNFSLVSVPRAFLAFKLRLIYLSC